MRRLDVATDGRLLLRLLRDPTQLETLTPHEASIAIDAADHARLLGWLISRISSTALFTDAPSWLKDRFIHAEALVAGYDRAVRWEIDRLNRALGTAGIRWVLLKGAGYLAASLSTGRGRRVADIDILVVESELARAEQLLKEHGWEFPILDAYDDRFYRQWMHELPPMVHRDRRSVVDLHHSILPRTSRLHPSTHRLLERSVEVEPGIRVLCPSHMVLHAAAHLFHDGEIAGAIRDMVDLDGLLRCFDTTDPAFWTDLGQEARELGLTRPAYYALRYSGRILGTPIPTKVFESSSTWGPPAPIRLLMDVLVAQTLKGRRAPGSSAAALALYIRSHWLRMPPLLLVRHLWRKAARRE